MKLIYWILTESACDLSFMSIFVWSLTQSAYGLCLLLCGGQIREMAVRASGAYKNCKPCVCLSGSKAGYEDEYPDRIQCSYRRTGGDVCSLSKMWGKELRVRLEGNSSGEITPATASSCRSESMICEGHNGSNEWVAHVEPGVLISFVSLLEGGNELKKIRFRYASFHPFLRMFYVFACEL